MNIPVPQVQKVGHHVQQLINMVIRTIVVVVGWQVDSVANVAALATVDDTRIPDGSSKTVRTLWDSFTLNKTSVEVADGITIVATMSGTGRWVRDIKPNALWGRQATWFIDPTTGDDENVGLLEAAPLATWAEFRRRTESVGYDGDTTVTILSSLPATDPVKLLANLGSGILTIQGRETLVYSGTAAAYSRDVDANPGGNNIGTLQDAGWTVADHIWRIVRFTSGAADGFASWILKDLGANNARITTCVDSDTYADAVPSAGDTFDVYTQPTVHDLTITADYGVSTGTPINIRNLHLTNTNVFASQAWCADVFAHDCKIDYIAVQHGNMLPGNVLGNFVCQSARMYVMGGALGYVSLGNNSSLYGVLIPVFMEGIPGITYWSLQLDGGSTAAFYDEVGFYDYTDVIVYLDESAYFEVASGIRGEGNVDVFVKMWPSTTFRWDSSRTQTINTREIELEDSGNTINDFEAETPYYEPHSGVSIVTDGADRREGGLPDITQWSIGGMTLGSELYVTYRHGESVVGAPAAQLEGLGGAYVVAQHGFARRLRAIPDVDPGASHVVTVYHAERTGAATWAVPTKTLIACDMNGGEGINSTNFVQVAPGDLLCLSQENADGLSNASDFTATLEVG